MKMAKSYKIGLLLTTLIISLIAFLFCLPTANGAEAISPSVASEYFNGTAKEISFKDDGVSAVMGKDDTLEFVYRVALDKLGMELKTDAKVKKLELNFSTKSYNENGSKFVNEEGRVEYLPLVERTLAIEFNANQLSVQFDETTASATLSGNLNIEFKVIDNVLYAYVEGEELVNTDKKYMVADYDLVPAENMAFKVSELASGAESTDFLLLYVDQDTSDITQARKQTFVLNSNDQIANVVNPLVMLGSNCYTPDGYDADGKIYIKRFEITTLTINSFSVFGNINTSNLYIAKADENDADITIEDSTSAKILAISSTGMHQIVVKCNLINYADKIFRTFNVEVYENDTEAPKYIDSTNPNYDALLEEYKENVKDATKVYDEKLKKEVYVKIGDNYQVPELKELVRDNYESFSKLNKTVYYMTPNNDTASTTSNNIPISHAGDYTFYVIFSDKSGNAMEKDDFFTVDENDENAITEGVYFDFVFKFHIEDQSTFTIDASKKQGTGYTGTFYTATEFKISASDYSETYNLWYNEKANATSEDDGWVEIIKSADLTDKYVEDVFTADEIKSINYDGRLSFTPNAVGTYRINCEITSDNSSRTAVAETFINVEKLTVVKPFTPLTTRQIWAVVFLSVGGACLVGIIVLIFIKPKEKNEEND